MGKVWLEMWVSPTERCSFLTAGGAAAPAHYGNAPVIPAALEGKSRSNRTMEAPSLLLHSFIYLWGEGGLSHTLLKIIDCSIWRRLWLKKLLSLGLNSVSVQPSTQMSAVCDTLTAFHNITALLTVCRCCRWRRIPVCCSAARPRSWRDQNRQQIWWEREVIWLKQASETQWKLVCCCGCYPVCLRNHLTFLWWWSH